MKQALMAVAVLLWLGGCGKNDTVIEEMTFQGAFCNSQCSADPACTGGQWNLCNGACVDLSSTPTNCGACGQACIGANVCQNGHCVASGVSCTAGLTPCGAQCVNTTVDNANCGGCNVTCTAGQSCVAGVCTCTGADQLMCGGSCVDKMSNYANCGSCGNTCTNGKICVSGQCSCAAEQKLCDNSCVDTKTNVNHCGSCAVSCKNGKTCQAGTCVCPSNAQLCGSACADLNKDTANCGSCGKKCTGGEACVSGTCKCAEGQTKCKSVCADVTKDTKNCGACDKACYGSESCTEGTCRAPIGADGCSGPAQKLTLSDLASYQSIKVPLFTGQKEVAKASRVAEIIQGHETLFRFFVKPESGWTAHETSARITVTNGATEDQYFSKKSISKASTDADANNSFQVAVSPDKIQAETTYSAEIVECGKGATGTASTARFPATGTAKLSAFKTGVIKIIYIPVSYNNLKPDVTEKTLALYTKYLMAMYPTTKIEVKVATEMAASTSFFGLAWESVLDQVRRKRQSDSPAPASDEYYFALIKPAATFEEYCRTSCTLGISYVAGVNDGPARVAMGAAYAEDAADVEMTAVTIAHELGHSHGQNHAPCAQGGQISGVDNNYPSDSAHAGAKIGVWGYDSRNPNKFIDPTKTMDIMGYCRPQWISDYTFKAFTKRVAAINSASYELRNTALQAKWRVLLLDSSGAHWGIPYDQPGDPYGQAEDVIIFDAAGSVVKKVTGYRTLIAGDENAAMVLIPEPEAGWAAVQAEGWPAIVFPRP